MVIHLGVPRRPAHDQHREVVQGPKADSPATQRFFGRCFGGTRPVRVAGGLGLTEISPRTGGQPRIHERIGRAVTGAGRSGRPSEVPLAGTIAAESGRQAVPNARRVRPATAAAAGSPKGKPLESTEAV